MDGSQFPFTIPLVQVLLVLFMLSTRASRIPHRVVGTCIRQAGTPCDNRDKAVFPWDRTNGIAEEPSSSDHGCSFKSSCPEPPPEIYLQSQPPDPHQAAHSAIAERCND